MVERIDIIVPEEILLLNEEKKDRLKRTHQFQETDRAPVVVDMQLWALLEGSGTEFKDMIKNPYEHMRGLILNHKYRYEQMALSFLWKWFFMETTNQKQFTC